MNTNFDQDASQLLMGEDERDYGEDYRDDYLTLYRDYVASADTISSRRATANSFFLTVNTAFLGARGYFNVTSDEGALIQAFVGVLFCLVWARMISSYKTLNSAKFKVIQMMERHLPLAAYTAEEHVYNNSPVKHTALSSVEALVPLFFVLLYAGVAIFRFAPK
jgi:hypothetical protein